MKYHVVCTQKTLGIRWSALERIEESGGLQLEQAFSGPVVADVPSESPSHQELTGVSAALSHSALEVQ